MMFQQHAINERHAEKDRRVMFVENLADNFRRRLLATKNRRETVEQRKGETVSESVGKRQARRREKPIAFAQAQNFATESFVGVKDICLTMDGAFGLAGAARGVENERVCSVVSGDGKVRAEWLALCAVKSLRTDARD